MRRCSSRSRSIRSSAEGRLAVAVGLEVELAVAVAASGEEGSLRGDFVEGERGGEEEPAGLVLVDGLAGVLVGVLVVVVTRAGGGGGEEARPGLVITRVIHPQGPLLITDTGLFIH